MNLQQPVCLIIPPSSFLLNERVFVSLGILKIAAVLEQRGIKVELLDLSGVKNFLDVVCDHAKVSKSKHFAITATTPQMPAVKLITKNLRKVRPDAKIIIGGPHVTLINAAYKKENQNKILFGRATIAMRKMEEISDVLVAGDGEEAIFLALIDNPKKLIDADLPNSSLFLTNEKLNTLPFPARHFVDIKSYKYDIEGVSAISLIAQLGCPFECGFCGGRKSPALRKVRTRNSENIVAEMVHLWQTYGFRGFMFYDDELNVNKKFVELLNLISKKQKELGVEWRLRGFVKSQLFTDEQAKAMYEAGFRWILVGFESGSEEMLRAMNKKSTVEQNTRCLEIAKRNGLKTKALMSFGHPGESESTIRETKDWLLSTNPEDIDISIITCYPGTPYYDDATEFNVTDKIWVYKSPYTGGELFQKEIDYLETADYYKGDPDGGYEAYVFTRDLSSKRLVELRNETEKNVRTSLGIPFYKSGAAISYEHSMGQNIPDFILRSTKK